MKPISVLLVHRDSDIYRRLTGWWSYPVDEFTWKTLAVKRDGFLVDMNYAPKGIDLVVLDDWIFGRFNNLKTPLAYCVVDSNRSDAQLRRNFDQARQADLVLLDQDKLERFSGLDKPIRRFAYAVNEQLYYPREKVYDVAFLCVPTPERRPIAALCEEICKRHNWCFVTGVYEWDQYARFICSAKVVVNKPHFKAARSWRVFDTLASRGCLLTEPLQPVSGDGFIPGLHYCEYTDAESLERELTHLLADDHWKQYAEAGYEHVMQHHTWRTRATELRATLHEVFGW